MTLKIYSAREVQAASMSRNVSIFVNLIVANGEGSSCMAREAAHAGSVAK